MGGPATDRRRGGPIGVVRRPLTFRRSGPASHHGRVGGQSAVPGIAGARRGTAEGIGPASWANGRGASAGAALGALFPPKISRPNMKSGTARLAEIGKACRQRT